MWTSSEIYTYWAWHLEREAWIGLACQILGLYAFFALWWLQDRGWRIVRISLIVYFSLLGIFRFALWLAFGILSTSVIPGLKTFIIRSGLSGLLICVGMVIFLFVDRKKNLVSFETFSPEEWRNKPPGLFEITALFLAFIGLWWPFMTDADNLMRTSLTPGFPTGFGTTLAPTLIFVYGLITSGSRLKNEFTGKFLAAGICLSALLVEPWTLPGLLAFATGLFLIYFKKR